MISDRIHLHLEYALFVQPTSRDDSCLSDAFEGVMLMGEEGIRAPVGIISALVGEIYIAHVQFAVVDVLHNVCVCGYLCVYALVSFSFRPTSD